MPPDDRIRVLHMIEAAEAAAQFLVGRARSDLDARPHAALRARPRDRSVWRSGRETLCADEDEHPGNPLAADRGDGNRLVHAYFDIDRDILWKAATDELPLLSARLRRMLAEPGEPQS